MHSLLASNRHCLLRAVCAALTAICKLISPDLINAVLPLTVELLTHQRELVRKKAVMALHRYLQLDPERDGPLAGIDLDRHLRQALCDKVCICIAPHALLCPGLAAIATDVLHEYKLHPAWRHVLINVDCCRTHLS